MIIRAADNSTIQVSHQAEFKKHVILANGVVPGLLQCATAYFDVGDEISPHEHESMTEIFYLMSGKLQVELDASLYIINKGDAFTVFPGVIHSIKFLAASQLFYFNIETLISDRYKH